MVNFWPLSVFYRAYFGTMKFKERFAFCICLILLVVPFILLRMRSSNDGPPLILAVSDTESLLDGMDFNRIDHSHVNAPRSSEVNFLSTSDLKDPAINKRSLVKDTPDNVESQVVQSETKNNTSDEENRGDKIVNNDVDYEFDDPWLIWKGMVNSRQLTSPDDKDSVNMILEAMAFKPIVAANVGYRGTQLKAMLVLEGAQKVVFKPMRYSRDYVVKGTPFAGFDRHNGEIAAFHLDRILGFYRAPPVVGRRVNLEEEVEPIGEKKLMDTFFKEGKNTCFYGVCYYCKKTEAACANGTVMEGSVTIWLPPGWPLKNWRHPWQRTYIENRKAVWEVSHHYCKKVLSKAPYDSGPRLLDITDTALFDFLIGNADRHHYETFRDEGDDGMVVHLDNAKSFGNPHHDEMSILAPVYQCCRIRQSTWNRFQSIYKGKTALSELLRKATENDTVYPILTELHLKAIDRRLKIAIDKIKECIAKNGENKVLISEEAIENGGNS